MNDCSKTAADSSQSSLLEPKEEPLDDFLFMPAENEPLNDSSLLISGPNGVIKIEDDFVDQAFMNSMQSMSYMRAEMDIKDEESTNAHYAIADSIDCLSTIPHFTPCLTEPKVESMETKEEPIDIDQSITDDIQISDDRDSTLETQNSPNEQMLKSSYMDGVEQAEVGEGGENYVVDAVVNTTHAPIDSSDSVEVEKRRRPSRTVTKPLKYTESMDDSDEVEEPSVKKTRSESEKKNEKGRSARGKVAQLGRAINSPQPKKNNTELKCLECEFRTRSVSSWMDHLRKRHSTTPFLAGFALLCECGHESEAKYHSTVCTIANFTVVRRREGPIRRLEDEKTTPQYVMCEIYPSTLLGYTDHLRKHHKSKSTLIVNGIYLICSCGHEIRSEHSLTTHSTKCDGRDFSLHKLDEKTTPKCVLCEVHPRTPFGYAQHLRKNHKSTLIVNGIYLICLCGHEIRSERSLTTHCTKCDGRDFSLHKLNEKTTPQCVLCEVYPSTPVGYAQHLRLHHKYTFLAKEIFLICSCGEEISSEHSAKIHSKKCDCGEFTVHKLNEK